MEKFLFLTDKDALKETLREVIKEEKAQISDTEFKERLSKKEAAEFLGITRVTLYKWIKKGVIKERGIGRKKYFLKSELLSAVSSS